MKKAKKLLQSAKIYEAQTLFEVDPKNAPAEKKSNWSNPNRNKDEWRYTPKLPTPMKKKYERENSIYARKRRCKNFI